MAFGSFFGFGNSGNSVVTAGQNAYYGAFEDNTDQFATSTTQSYYIRFDTIDIANGVTIQNDVFGFPTKITFANSGIYSCTFSIQLSNSSNNTIGEADVWLEKNGIIVPDSNTRQSVVTQHGQVEGTAVVTVNFLLNLNANDFLQLAWAVNNTDVYIAHYPSGTTPTTPEIPSIIFTAVSMAQIGIGYSGLTSTTSNTIGVGTFTFTTNLSNTQTAFAVGNYVVVQDSTNPNNFIYGYISSFNGTTLVLQATSSGGSGTKTSWIFTQSYPDIVNIVNVNNSSPVTGTTNFTIATNQLIKGNTIKVGGIYNILQRFIKTGTNAGTIIRFYVNTVIDLSGAIQLGSFTASANTTVYTQMERHLFIKSATNTEVMGAGASAGFDNTAVGTLTNANIDWTIDQYLLFVVQNSSALDSSVNSGYYIKKI